jgi:hypothetical protein
MKSKAEIRFRELNRKSTKTKEEIQELENCRLQFAKEMAEQSKELVAEIKSFGYDISSISDVMNARYSYPEIIPTLISHLKFDYHNAIRESIVRSLIVKEAKGKAIDALLDLYEQVPNDEDNQSLRWSIPYAIRHLILKKDNIERIKKIAIAEKNETCKNEYIKALKKVKVEL